MTGLIKTSLADRKRQIALQNQIDGSSDLSVGDRNNCFVGHHKEQLQGVSPLVEYWKFLFLSEL